LNIFRVVFIQGYVICRKGYHRFAVHFFIRSFKDKSNKSTQLKDFKLKF
jgi:hypothetical protein